VRLDLEGKVCGRDETKVGGRAGSKEGFDESIIESLSSNDRLKRIISIQSGLRWRSGVDMV
jgi:hypothetical protein